MNKTTLNNLNNHEFISYCLNINETNIEEIIFEVGILLKSAIERLETIEKYGCDSCDNDDIEETERNKEIVDKIKEAFNE